jgi:broad specificity phosphatase PhoE
MNLLVEANVGHIVTERPLFDEGVVYSWPALVAALRRLKQRPKHDLYFYRHAETEYNERNLISGQQDVPLSHKGLQQARLLRSSIPARYDRIFCSRLKRTWQTMHAAVGEPPVSVYVDRRINEVSLGELEGHGRRHIEAFAVGDIDFSPRGGESYRRAAQRAFSFVVDATRSAERTSLIFTHAGILRIIYSLVAPMDTPAQMFSASFKNAFCIQVRSNRVALPPFWTM